MNAGDTSHVHFFVASQSEGWNITVSDLTTGHSGTIVLNSKYGPLQASVQRQRRRPVARPCDAGNPAEQAQNGV